MDHPIYDALAEVPTDCGSPNGGDYDPVSCTSGTPAGPGNGFEISISNDLGDILTDPSTNDRYIYMEVTAISGASENGYELWAGPNTYVSAVSAEANLRNLQVLNAPGAHTSKGATIFAMGRMPMNSNENNRVDIPLIWVGPDQAGGSIYISLFDTDSGAAPPIHFFFDSIAREDWEWTFADGGLDPDGVPSNNRCWPGSCNNLWVNPAYEIQVPTNDNCDYSNTDPDYIRDNCTPFYGGRLVASYDGGNHDTYAWEIRLGGLPYLIR